MNDLMQPGGSKAVELSKHWQRDLDLEQISAPYKRASREAKSNDTLVSINGEKMGGEKILTIAGPCAVESREQILQSAAIAVEAGATALRGGAFKPRTSPYSFRGHREQALEWLAEARAQTGLAIVTEVMDTRHVPLVCRYADVLQIGSRNMQNFCLLDAAAESGHTILLKRGMASTIEEFLLAAEYILAHGNDNVILCERGIRTFETHTRNTFDINAIPVLKSLTHLPVISDPSHGTGHWQYVEAIARAAVAAGTDGLLIEMHPQPREALSDGEQSLTPKRFRSLMKQIKAVAQAIGRSA